MRYNSNIMMADLQQSNQQERKRTCSADSGICDTANDLHFSSLEMALRLWKRKLEKVLKQEMERAIQVSVLAEAALDKALEGDENCPKEF